jgi:ketosteroid isomerase-like protein
MSLPRRTTLLSLLALWSVPVPVLAAHAQAAKQQSTSGTSARTAIDAANKRFDDLFNKGDVAGAAKVYATDAIVLPPNGSPVHGQPAIADFWKGAYSGGVRNVVLTTTEFAQHGSYAHELGTYQLEVRKPDGSVVARDNGKYMVLWKRSAGGEWQWYRDIYNSSVPAPASK